MNLRLLSLVFAPFAFGTSAFVFVGLLEPMANDLNVGVPIVGQLQTAFAVSCGIGGPVLARLLSGYNKKMMLVGVMLLLAVMNVASALAPQFGAIAGIRFAGGLFAALAIPLASTIAVGMVPEEKRPAAIATVMGGYMLAFLIGMPLGSFFGDLYGWRSAFWFATVIALIATLMIAVATPRNVPNSLTPPADGSGINFRAALVDENAQLMIVSLLGFFATFMSVAYIGPVITKATGLEGSAIGGVQIAMGLGGILGLPAGAFLGRLPVRRALFILLSVICLTQVFYSVSMTFDLGWAALPIITLCLIFGSAAIFASLPVIQTRLAASSGAAATIAFAINSSMVYFGQGLGATLGGSVTAWIGLAWVGSFGAIVAAFALFLISRLKPT